MTESPSGVPDADWLEQQAPAAPGEAAPDDAARGDLPPDGTPPAEVPRAADPAQTPAEADPADVQEQKQDLPGSDDDYPSAATEPGDRPAAR